MQLKKTCARVSSSMPKKTREEKILSRLRRLEKVQTDSFAKETEKNEANFSLKEVEVQKSPTPPSNTSPARVALDYSYLKKDLLKILLLSTIGLALEVVFSIYFARQLQTLLF